MSFEKTKVVYKSLLVCDNCSDDNDCDNCQFEIDSFDYFYCNGYFHYCPQCVKKHKELIK